MKYFQLSDTNSVRLIGGSSPTQTLAAVRVLLLPILANVIGVATISCGKPESFASVNTARPGINLDKKPSPTKSPTDDSPESTPADEPQSVAGMYLLNCADYVVKPNDTTKAQSIGCDITDGKGNKVQMQNFANREWRAKDVQGKDATPAMHEDTNASSVRIFATHNTGTSADLSKVEFIFDRKKPDEKISFKFPENTKQFAALGTWSVVRTVPTNSGFAAGGLQILTPKKSLGLVKIEYVPGSTQDFIATVSGNAPIILDYADRDPSKIAQPGTSLFSGHVNNDISSIPIAAAKLQNVIPPDLNKNPSIQITKSPDGTITSMRVIVSQPRYGDTYWDFTPTK